MKSKPANSSHGRLAARSSKGQRRGNRRESSRRPVYFSSAPRFAPNVVINKPTYGRKAPGQKSRHTRQTRHPETILLQNCFRPDGSLCSAPRLHIPASHFMRRVRSLFSSRFPPSSANLHFVPSPRPAKKSGRSRHILRPSISRRSHLAALMRWRGPWLAT